MYSVNINLTISNKIYFIQARNIILLINIYKILKLTMFIKRNLLFRQRIRRGFTKGFREFHEISFQNLY